ncbi:efflux RND transporter periplasmic adaptor subunit [Ancylobacter sp. 6x-1]|uniref:Efflux RND transporter periplasmic adaptor subunit n=1 Tax=Ancylobacter crimeensis TaxID=2579147 RepID=A0ABT0D6Z8_9HYPH|nr:efflux RND transporter periplasmic adaptor subunit [Ancylobacter crimeensis]MCK0195726.1 efflux RND transporter periplasmic adaptor subunit [Ancylobacter crimeensis]
MRRDHRARSRTRRVWAAIALAGTGLWLSGCEEKNTYVPPPPARVTVAAPLQQSIVPALAFTGNTAAINAVDLVARVEGFLTAIDYTDGALVKKGDRLFLIQQNTYIANLDAAKASLTSAQAQQVNAAGEYNRQATLGKQDFSSQANVDKAKANLDMANAGVQSAEANLEIANINLGYTTVSAPFDGIVTRHLVDVGELVGHGAPTTLASIVQVDPIYVYFTVSEQQVLRIKEALAKGGQTLSDIGAVPVFIGLQTEEGYPHEGRLDYISPEVDPSTGTLQVRALLKNADHALMPGLFVRVKVPTRPVPDVLLVPDIAIGRAQQGSYVLTVNVDNVVEQKIISTGDLQGGYRVVRSGLAPSDRVIVTGIQRAAPGAKVDPQPAGPDDLPAPPGRPAAQPPAPATSPAP